MKKSRGFTLLELLIAISIVAILSALAAPSFKRLIQSTTISNGVNTFMADLRFARSEAVRRGGSVVMCRSDNPEAANPSCGSGSTNGWESGWIVFVDRNNDLGRDNNADENLNDTVLRVQGPQTSIDSIKETGAATKFQFVATGRLQSLSAITSVQFGGGQFTNDMQRMVCIPISGRARVAGDGNSSCS